MTMTALFTATCDTCGRPFQSKHQARVATALRKHHCDRWLAKQAAAARRLEREASIDRTPKPCHHKGVRHEHGTYVCYVRDICRCTPCSRANADYEHQRMRLHAYGRFTHMIDAEIVREHARTLQAAGMGIKTIAARAGVSSSSLGKILYGNPAMGHAKPKRVRTQTAERVLAVQPSVDALADGASVDGTGTRRRLQALIAIGWSQPRLAEAMGYELRNFCTILHGQRAVTVKTARSAREAYEQLWNTAPPQHNRWERAAYTRSLRYAAARSWAPPMAWDDDTIDDPAASPGCGAAADSSDAYLDEAAIVRRTNGDQTVAVTNEERREVVRRLHSRGLSDGDIERIAGINTRQVLRDRQRLSLPANADHGRRTGEAA